MLKLHPNILEKDGSKEFVVLPYEEFELLSQELADHEDLKDLRSTKHEEKDTPGKTLAEAREELGI